MGRNISRTVRNPNLQDKAKNLAEAIKTSGKLKDLLSQSVLEQHASRHNALIRVPQDTIVERRTTVLGGKKRLKFNQERVIYVDGFGQPVDTIDINE